MIHGTGIDLVSVARFATFIERRGRRGLERLFTAAELEYCLRVAVPALSLAARYAAKEAFFKALGTGYGRGIAWTELEIMRMEGGRPVLRLLGAAEAELERRGVRQVHVSLSHTDDAAAAIVILES